jgi:hypothetical protein
MSKESAALFKPLLAAGIIILALSVICIWIGTSVISLKEEGDGNAPLSQGDIAHVVSYIQ